MPKLGGVLLSERVREAGVPKAVPGQSMVLATWNVRELGRVKRSHRAIRMIARVLRSFSLVSLVELRRDTTDLRELFPREPMTKEGFTRQLSEHLRLWAEMRVGEGPLGTVTLNG